MKHLLTLIIAFTLVTILAPSCEVPLQFDDIPEAITVDAMVCPDTAMVVNVSKTFGLSNSPAYHFIDYHDYYTYHDSVYDTLAVIDNAEVMLTVNGGSPIQLMYNPQKHHYQSNYFPKEGDEVSLEVSVPDSINYIPVKASTTVLPAPEFEVLSHVSLYSPVDKGLIDPNKPYDIQADDTVMEITLKLKDNPREHNFYRLRVRSISDNWQTDSVKAPDGTLIRVDSTYWAYMTDIFTSSDILFLDYNIPNAFGGWQANFNYMFDDYLFRNGEYTVTLQSRQRIADNARVVVEYYSVTRDLYSYICSVLQYRTHTEDIFSNPIGIHTNIENGYGIFGSMNFTRQTLYFNDPGNQ
ncbi:MAG: DUF4249 domain-containing protein [Muribaculaceae bacterium]